jgi:hypothetical protein
LLSDSPPPATGLVENAVEMCVQPDSDTPVIWQVRNVRARKNPVVAAVGVACIEDGGFRREGRGLARASPAQPHGG